MFQAFQLPHAKGHNHKFPQAKGSDDGSLGNVGVVHVDLVVPLQHINLGKHGFTTKTLCKILYMRHRVAVWGHNCAQKAIISTGAPIAITLRHHVQVVSPGRRRAVDDASLRG